MTRDALSPLFFGCSLLLALTAIADEFEQTIPAAEDGTLVIDIDRGSVAVFSHAAPEVRVEAETRGVGASSVQIGMHQNGSDLLLRAEPAPWLAMLQSRPGVRIRAWVPAGYRVVRRGDEVELEGVSRRVGSERVAGSVSPQP